MHNTETPPTASATSVGGRCRVPAIPIAVAGIALAMLALLSPFDWIPGLLLLLLVGLAGPLILTVLTIYARRDLQAFGIGALFPAAVSFAAVVCLFVICTFDGWEFVSRADGLAGGAIASILGIALCGSLGVLVRRSIPRVMASSASISTGHWQVSIATLLGATAGIAILLTVLFKVPPIVTAVMLVALALAMAVALTTLVVYARGGWQTFGIGGLFPAAIQLSVATCFVIIATFDGWNVIANNNRQLYGLRVGSVLCWLMIAGCGWLAIRVRRLVEQRGQVDAEHSPSSRS